ncbi:MAG: hypothetical protein H7A47_14645 [Verrucomicrobiales bacterium]|nr:hypothetical protein [Verrucomicrobiales bacterium]
MKTPEQIYFRDLVKALHDPHGSIHYLVYVREPESVGPVADWIRRDPSQSLRGQPELTPLVRGLVKRDIVRISSRHPLPEIAARFQVDPRDIAPFQRGEALQVAPYGVVHIPGLIKDQLRSGLKTNDTGFTVTRAIDRGMSH